MLYFRTQRGVLTLINFKKSLGLDYYISALDQFLTHFDTENQKLSPSQRQERAKYKRIFELRDHSNVTTPKKGFWENF